MALLKPRTTHVLIYQGDDLETIAELQRAADHAERSGTPLRLGDVVEDTPEQQALDAFIDGAAERAVDVELVSIGSRRFRELVEAHPPRMVGEEVHEEDAHYGVDVTSFPMALLSYREGDVRTVGSPDASAPELFEFLADEVSEGDFERLWVTAYYLNRAPGRDPKAERQSSEPSPSGSTTSESPTRVG